MELTEQQQLEVAAQLDADPDHLPYLAELLADLDDLGCEPEISVDLLRPLGLSSEARVLDLGCGKGSVAIAIARELSLAVEGVDLFPPFIEAARSRAEREGVSSLCRFSIGDLRRALAESRDLDVVSYQSVGVLGAVDQAIGQLRRGVRPGGHLLIADGYLRDAELARRSGYQHYVGHGDTVERLRCHGDELVAEITFPMSRLAETNRRQTELIRRRALDLARRFPQRAELFRSYVARQEEECAALERGFVEAVWLLRRL